MNQRKTFAAVLFLIFAGAYSYFNFYKTDPAVQPKILIAQNDAYSFYSEEDILKLSKSLSEKGFYESEDFSKQPFVEKAVLVKSLVGPAQITVYLQEPVLALLTKGVYKLVDKTGEVFSEVPQYKIPNLPILNSPDFDLQKNRLKAVNMYLKLEKEGMLSKKSLSEILMKEDLVFIFSGVKGRVFINEKKTKEQLSRLSKVIKYLRFHGLEAEVLDSRFEDRVVVSLNKNKVS
jgi:hypothetical protein